MTIEPPAARDRPPRSLLFVPALRPDMMAKAAASAADAVCLDLEDSVPLDAKPAARANAVRALLDLDFGSRLRVLRVNAVDTPFTYRDLVEVVEQAGDHLDAIMLPKAGSSQDLTFVDTLLGQIEAARGWPPRLRVQAQIESARGFVYVREIAASVPRLHGLIFGAGDYAASMRMPSSAIGERDEDDLAYPGDRWHAVMHAIVAASRAHGLWCMDGPFAAYQDHAGLEQACRVARALGFDGKQCIHPAQVPVVHRIFTPSPEEVARAAALVQAYETAVAEGRGAAVHEGRMIDAASLRMARTILERR